MKANTAIQWTKKAISTLDLSGRRLAVIGGTDGLGRAIAKQAASRGANVTVVGRTFRDKGEERIDFIGCDLSLMSEAKRLGASLLDTKTDTFLFTTGIVPARKREVTSEGLERDMAVSFLSRAVALQHLVPRLDAAAPRRVFIMGFPGAGQAGKLGDLNADLSYSALTVHMNTVAGNEALVLHGAAAWRARGVRAYGLNPGLVRTGIRANLLGTGPLARALEATLGHFTPSPAAYAETAVPLLYAPELDAHSGAIFNQAGAAILPTPALDPARVAALLGEADALIARARPA